ncbi:Uncharacterised protein [[Clostridium] sordellii]|uniref:ACT domain protein n=2 Tax=Paraclostridium sordellii TaxID=1505 RepID=A0A9P1PA05_PARSO|nr:MULTISPECIES: hypothetical protein [Paeniclostridium]EPZ62002.1 hypothetical protein H477_5774 [[Clostridium] sordellii ATCC 9714] [Paeniclostridium sordellii ATCC 9714]MDU5020466.1 hypothetical protein [Clostridiales bacterium]AUN12812.1 hypothetical protein RSJ16_00290 [Paeniclostridium sordellii]MBW4862938.1 hypothetical protein [Paeniclostridium sp.]MBW4872612.1 hypothetical protein [Paeniclostridium sp.]
MRFSINMCRGSLVDIIKLAEEKSLLIESIEQGPINDDMVNIKIKLLKDNEIHSVDSFVNSIKELNSLNTCDII